MKSILKNIKIISVVVTLIFTQLLGYTSIYLLGDYGWSIFVLIPLIIGFLPVYMTGTKTEIKRNTAYTLSFITLGFSILSLLIFAIEGLICILMASPLLIPLVWLGSYLSYKIVTNNDVNPKGMTLILTLLSLSFISFDYVNKPNELIPVRTEIVVNASINKVWTNVVTFDNINEPADWIFTTGISYPTDATIKGTGVGAIRYCNFTTGSFVEPITTWNKPYLLQFDVIEQPMAMNEINPFWEVHPPHLDGYFKSYKGQFKLTKMEGDRTKLEGTTWYKIDIYPKIYWKQWSDFIIHSIHKRVLNHIKNISE